LHNDYFDKLTIKNKPKSFISEAYRTLSMEMKYSGVSKDLKSILITSPLPQEGKSTIAANLALVFAEGGDNVFIIDANLRCPSIHKFFKSENVPGLTELLSKKKRINEVIKNNQEIDSNLHFIASGKVSPNPSKLLGSEKMFSIIESIKEQTNIVIIDSSPIIGLADSLSLANQVDGLVLVLRAGMVTKDVVQRTIALLDKVEANIIGIVLNYVDLKRNDYYPFYNRYLFNKYYKT